MFVLGITGGIGTGKSTAAAILRSAGAKVIDADAIAHALTSQAGETTEAIGRALGPAILKPDGSLDRQKLADLAFTNKRLLDELSAIIHQEVVKEIDARLEEERGKKTPLVVLDVPIPVKRGFLDVCDQVWTLTADLDSRLARLRRRGMEEAEAMRRIGVQMTPQEYRDLASHEIENRGSLLDLENRLLTLLDEELGQRGIRLPGLAERISSDIKTE